MTIEDAIKAIKEKEPFAPVLFAIEIDDGFVFFVEGEDQPIYVTKNWVRGINTNAEEDRKLMDKAHKKWESGDFY